MTGAGTGGKDPQKGATVREAEDIGAIIARILAARKVKERVRPDSIFNAWKDVVGAEIAAQTRPVKVQRGVLTVEVSSAPLLNELSTYHREEILESIRARPEFAAVQDIRFRASG